MVLARALTRHRRVGLDAAVLIYAAETQSPLGDAARQLLDRVGRGEIGAVISTVGVAEFLVLPYRLHRADAAERYVSELQARPGLAIVAPDLAICRLAARLRAAWQTLKLPDALHLATAIEAGATAFVTNDQRLPKLAHLEVLKFSDLTSA